MAVSLFKILGEVFIDDKQAIESMNNVDKKAEDTSKNGLQKFTDGANRVGTTLLAVGAGIAAGATALIAMGEKSANTALSVSKLSTATQMSNKDVQEWSYVFQKTGASTDSLQTAVTKLGLAMAKGDEGSKKITQAFKELGIATTDNQGKLKSSSALFDESIKKLASMTDITERNRQAQLLFGGSYTELLPILNKGSAGIEDLKKRANELGLVMTDQEVNSGAKYKKSMTALKEEFGSVATKLGNDMLPYFGKFADWLKENTPKITEFINKVLKVLGDTIKFVSDNGNAFSVVLGLVLTGILALNAIKTIQQVMTAWNTVVKIATALQKAWNLVMEGNPIGLVILAITALITAGVLLYKNWDVVKAKATEVFGAIGTFVGGIIDGISSGFKGMVNGVVSGLNTMIRAVDSIHFSIPDWVPGLGGKSFGINIPQIPMLAKGTNYFQGGMAIVGENGPELVQMPRGSKVIPNDKSQKMNGITQNITINSPTALSPVETARMNRKVLQELVLQF